MYLDERREPRLGLAIVVLAALLTIALVAGLILAWVRR